MVASNLGQVVVYNFSILSALWILNRHAELMTPKCDVVYAGSPVLRWSCYVSNFCLWTLPPVSGMVVVFTFWKYLYESRLYHECLLHRIMIIFRPDKARTHPMTAAFIIYTVLALSSVFFAPSYLLIANFLAPLSSFLLVYMSWMQIEDNLIPLPKFCAIDPELAQVVLQQCHFVPETRVRVAFEVLDEKLRLDGEDVATTPHYFASLSEACSREADWALRYSATPRSSSTDNGWYAVCDVGSFSSSSEQVSRPDVLSIAHTAKHLGAWWVFRLLHSRYLEDDRARSFKRWAFAHAVVAVVMVLCLCELYKGFAIDSLKAQHLL